MTVSYHYRAATAAGQIIEGTLQAPSRLKVLEDLSRRQLYPVTVDEVVTGIPARAGRRLGRRAALGLWTRSAATLLGAGVPLDRVLQFTIQHAGHDGLAAVLREVRRAVQGGASLADALERHPRYFPPVFVAMVAAGESSGALDIVLERLAQHLEEVAELRSQIRSALLYPALMAAVASIGVTVLLLFVIPRFATILADVGSTLPLSTRLLVGMSVVLTKGWWVLVLGAAGIGLWVRSALARVETRRRWHTARLAWPWTGDLELKYVTAQFARTLALLLKSGVALLPALKIARSAAANISVQEGIDRASAAVSEGSPLAPALAGVLPPLALQMLAVGEESGRMEELCESIANTYDAEVRRALRTAVAMIEPALILVFGAVVGFVALAMLQAIYGINTKAFS
jgi:type II secretory pathway component PulF